LDPELRAILLYWFGTTDAEMIHEHMARKTSGAMPFSYVVKRVPPPVTEKEQL